MERIFWLLSGSDSQVIRALMEQFERTKSVSLPKELHSKVSYHSHTMEKKQLVVMDCNPGNFFSELW